MFEMYAFAKKANKKQILYVETLHVFMLQMYFSLSNIF